MPNYRYQARNEQSQFVEGTHDSADLRTAREELQQRGLTILSLEAAAFVSKAMPVPKGWDLGVSRKELARFTRQLSTMIRSGLHILKALESVSRRSSGVSLQRAVAQVARQVNEGSRFSQALASQPKVFDELYVAMVRVGEMGGDLSEATDRLALLLEREVSAQRRMGMALTYPLIVLGVAALLTWAMATFMMPLFEPVFRDAGLNLQRDFPVTHFLMQMGRLGGSPWLLASLPFEAVAVALLTRLLSQSPKARWWWDRAKLSLPLVSSLIRMLLTARFARGLSALTRAGIPLVQAVTQAGEATGNRVYALSSQEMAQGVQAGQRISQLLAERPLFNPVLVDMVEVGEQSGSLPEMLERAADYFDEEADGLRDFLTTAMEPMMMLLVGTIVSLFVVALMVPLMSMAAH